MVGPTWGLGVRLAAGYCLQAATGERAANPGVRQGVAAPFCSALTLHGRAPEGVGSKRALFFLYAQADARYHRDD